MLVDLGWAEMPTSRGKLAAPGRAAVLLERAPDRARRGRRTGRSWSARGRRGRRRRCSTRPSCGRARPSRRADRARRRLQQPGPQRVGRPPARPRGRRCGRSGCGSRRGRRGSGSCAPCRRRRTGGSGRSSRGRGSRCCAGRRRRGRRGSRRSTSRSVGVVLDRVRPPRTGAIRMVVVRRQVGEHPADDFDVHGIVPADSPNPSECGSLRPLLGGRSAGRRPPPRRRAPRRGPVRACQSGGKPPHSNAYRRTPSMRWPLPAWGRSGHELETGGIVERAELGLRALAPAGADQHVDVVRRGAAARERLVDARADRRPRRSGASRAAASRAGSSSRMRWRVSSSQSWITCFSR